MTEYEEKKAREREMYRQFVQEGLVDGQRWYFWCLKGHQLSHYSQEPDGWEWPPRMSGRIAATSKAEAKQRIAEEFGEDFPMRVLRKDQVKHPFLLYIEPMEFGGPGERYIRRFILRECAECGTPFTLNDKYNDPKSSSHSETCSHECEQAYRFKERAANFGEGSLGVHPPLIYVITHKPTGQRYVGKTEQAFTLRWYQHMYQPGSSGFHKLVASSSVVDWQFEVVEHLGHILASHTGRRDKSYRDAIAAREQHWIDHFNSLSDGLNSVPAKKIDIEGCVPVEDPTEKE